MTTSNPIEIARGLLAGGVGTPFLAVSRDALRASLARWHRHLPDVCPHYAVKANVDPLVLRELFAGGAAADVASAFEMDVCRVLGLGGDRMILSHPRKDLDTIRAMSVVRPWGTAVDSEEEVDKLAAAGVPGGGYDPVLFVRVKVPTRGVVQDLNSKFGVRVLAPAIDGGRPKLQLAEARSVFRRAAAAGFSRFGLSFHVGTQCTDPGVYLTATRVAQGVADALRADGVAVGWVDIGGGFADRRVATAASPPGETDPHDRLLVGVAASCRELRAGGMTLIAEPGRYLVADAGFLVTRVVYDRATAVTGQRVQIDDGVYRTLSAVVHDERRFEFQAFRAGPDPRPFAPAAARFTLWGCSCDSFDKVADEALLPADLGVGDCLLSECVGAYSTSFGSNTNGFAPAPVVLYWRDGPDLRWEVSPLARQNDVLLGHIRRWADGRAEQ